MALTGVQIFKLLPKTNCKKCGHPTCLAYAMKLAARQAKIEDCPDMSEDAKGQLGEASAPPIRPITLGVGDLAVKVGEETVLFRHEKKFVHPAAIVVEIKDTAADAEATIKAVIESEIDRVGQKLRVDAIMITNASGDSGKLEAMAKLVADKAPAVPVIINTSDAGAAKAALAPFSGKKPMLYGADASNAEAMAAAAKEAGAIVGVKAANLDELAALTEKIKAAGIEDMVMDSGARSAKEIIANNTYIRRAALKKGFKPFGYPVINFCQREDELVETQVAVAAIAKYGSMVVITSVKKWKSLALFTLRQNIYTDPQVPMQVKQDVYKLGDPSKAAPLMITTNFSLTYFIVSGEIENSKVPARLAVMDCEGLSVLTAWAAGKFTATKIAAFIQECGVENEIDHKELILPGYVAILSGALEDKLPGWKITVGPREANAIPAFLKQR
jgi:acetyl-CoA decarbonylase/synthase complex subunit gamma